MKYLNQTIFILTIFLFTNCAYAQNPKIDLIKFYAPLISEKSFSKNNHLNKYASKDFSAVWNHHQKDEYLGFIGDDFYRIRIKILSAVKDKEKLQTYTVKGKTAIDNEIKSFQGTFTIKQVKLFTEMRWGVDDEYKNKGIKAQGVLIGEYKLYEDRNLKNSGYFEGVLSALWYMTSEGEVKFDNIEFETDPYRNNQFIGMWTRYDGTKKLKSNWGDYRIPDSGDLDVGAGEFSPNSKYLKNGWKSYAENLHQIEKDAFDWNIR
jgi:hypothetical protein